MQSRVFLLSPASTSGRRAALLFSDGAAFPLALAVREAGGATVGDVFSFLSGLYFRGKLAYATRFAAPPAGTPGALVITSSRGLMPPDSRVDLGVLREFAGVPIDVHEERYRAPLLRDAVRLRDSIDERTEVVLLGSIATDKYVSLLQDVFGERLKFPLEFVGRGDMSRGGLMLRCVDSATELTYTAIAGAVRRGQRPPKLSRRQ